MAWCVTYLDFIWISLAHWPVKGVEVVTQPLRGVEASEGTGSTKPDLQSPLAYEVILTLSTMCSLLNFLSIIFNPNTDIVLVTIRFDSSFLSQAFKLKHVIIGHPTTHSSSRGWGMMHSIYSLYILSLPCYAILFFDMISTMTDHTTK